eukprot:5801396-Prymnesium_polylepis.1
MSPERRRTVPSDGYALVIASFSAACTAGLANDRHAAPPRPGARRGRGGHTRSQVVAGFGATSRVSHSSPVD